MLVFAALLALYHTHLLGRGVFAWPDEHVYRDAWDGVRALQAGDARAFAQSVTGFAARPFEALLRIFPAWQQLRLEDEHGILRTSAESLQIATSINVVVSFLLTMVFYRLSRWFFDTNRSQALLATAVYSLLVTTNVWIRHVLPYDTALLLALTAFLCVLKVPVERPDRGVLWRCAKACWPAGILILAYPVAFFRFRSAAIPLVAAIVASLVWSIWVLSRDGDRRSTRWAMVAGFLAALSTATYPAYYSLPAVFGVLILVGAHPNALVDLRRMQVRLVCVYGAAAAVLMFAFELLARIGDVSYLGSAARLSGTIALGNFDEGYIFLPRYFATAESAIGLTLLGLAAAYVPLRLRARSLSPSELGFARIAILIAAAYLVYATQSTVLHRMAFTERYIRIYVPFVVWAAISAIRLIPGAVLRSAIVAWCIVASVGSFAMFARDYDGIGYPLDALRVLRIGYEDVVPENRVDETEVFPNYNLPAKNMVAAPDWITRPGDRRFILVNFSWFRMTGHGLPRFVPPRGAAMLYDAPHFLTFRSAPFEGWMPERRREFEKRRYRLTVYRVNPAALPAPPSSAPFARAGSR